MHSEMIGALEIIWLADFLCGGPDCKYFGSVAIWFLWQLLNSAVVAQKLPQIQMNGCGCIPISLFMGTEI